MVRIGRNLLPVYTQPSWSYFWCKSDIGTHCKKHFAEISFVAGGCIVRFGFYSGQFCVLASVDGNIVEHSIDRLKYHADIAHCAIIDH